MTFETFHRLIETHRADGHAHLFVPVFRRVGADLLTPVSAFLRLRSMAPDAFLLESVEGGEKLGRYSFLGARPYLRVEVRGERVVLHHPDRSEKSATDFFTTMRQLLRRYHPVSVPELPRFTGGAVGYLGYDMVRQLEHLPSPPPDDLELPDARWNFYDTVVAFDHVRHQLVLMAGVFVEPDTELHAAYDEAVARLDMLSDMLAQASLEVPEPVALPAAPLTSNFSRNAFCEAVCRAKEYIYEGDIFQVVLSQRFAMPYTGDRFNLYRALRQVNPSPYLFYIDFGDLALIGSSPEVLVRVEHGRAEVLPIAGTRPRGRTPEEDQALEAELKADPKEQAEHLMLVDLGRNDLGRVCRFGTVQVDRFAFVVRYSHVMHLVSLVSGELASGYDALDALAACFPAGTVSGAPKVRAMEIIDELEPTRRGVYAGAVGYMDFSGNLDTCIAIRTMVVRNGTIYIQAGAGIVADSEPEREYEETVNKARALVEAMRVAASGLL
ncbi:anthranilate synthase component I [Rhodothermus profundi]|nr:anthranilate synthase component I [Rhodothermus profundi]